VTNFLISWFSLLIPQFKIEEKEFYKELQTHLQKILEKDFLKEEEEEEEEEFLEEEEKSFEEKKNDQTKWHKKSFKEVNGENNRNDINSFS
jgi:hypothetical protein